MDDPLDDLRLRLKRAATARKRAEAALERARAELAALITEAAGTPMRQSEIVELTDYTREHVRRITRGEVQRSTE